MYIFHITHLSDWQAAKKLLTYEGDTYTTEGFIHCSGVEQLVPVAGRYFKGQQDLVILCINPQKLTKKVIYENLEGGSTLFPHVYERIPLAAIEKVINFPPMNDGSFSLPSEIVTLKFSD